MSKRLIRWGTCLAALSFIALPATASTEHQPAWDKVPLAIGHEKPDLVLTGTIDHGSYQKNLAVPFDVPKGIDRIGVELQYTKGDGKTTINLGLFDGENFRGWSGSNKHAVVIDENNATPSYTAGPVGGRRWSLDLGVSFISEGVTSDYTAKVWFWRHGERPAVSTFSPEPLRTGARWYRGDFHMHTGESDGFCDSREGRHVPCPVFKTVEAAEANHLDFIGMSDHNNVGHYNAMRELQPYFDDVLLIPAREMTTAQGHANIFGTTEFVEYRLGSKAAPDMKTMLRLATEAGAIVSINHPNSPSDYRCRGCGWTAPDDATPYVSAMEAMNGGGLRMLMNGGHVGDSFARWEREVATGRRMTALGGSDDHDVELGRYGVGFPTTLVYAADLSERAILDGVKAGHVWLDFTAAPGHSFNLQAHTASATGIIGDNFVLPAGGVLSMDLEVGGSAGASLIGLVDGKPVEALSRPKLGSNDETMHLEWQGDGGRHWIRFEVRARDKPLMFANPVYLNFAS
jgi:hypothetical protein